MGRALRWRGQSKGDQLKGSHPNPGGGARIQAYESMLKITDTEGLGGTADASALDLWMAGLTLDS